MHACVHTYLFFGDVAWRRTSSHGPLRLVLIAPLNCWRNSTPFLCKASFCMMKIYHFRARTYFWGIFWRLNIYKPFLMSWLCNVLASMTKHQKIKTHCIVYTHCCTVYTLIVLYTHTLYCIILYTHIFYCTHKSRNLWSVCPSLMLQYKPILCANTPPHLYQICKHSDRHS